MVLSVGEVNKIESPAGDGCKCTTIKADFEANGPIPRSYA
jgi:hypothetical protein